MNQHLHQPSLLLSRGNIPTFSMIRWFSPLTPSKPCQALAAETSTKMTMIAMRGRRRPGTFTWVIPFPSSTRSTPSIFPNIPGSNRAPTTSQLSNVKQHVLLTPSQASTNRLSHVSTSPNFWKPPARSPPVTTPETHQDRWPLIIGGDLCLTKWWWW